MNMKERRELNEMLFTLRDAYHIQKKRLAGDPDREPDETTAEDVVEAMFQRRASPEEVMRHKDAYTQALRLMIRGIDQQG